MHGEITFVWGDRPHTFRLGLDQLEELEAKCGRSVFSVAERLQPSSRAATSGEIREVLRLGLIGGGTPPADAFIKVRQYVDQRPLDENRDAALAVVLAGLARVHSSELDPPPGEAEAAETSASTSPPSTETPS